MSPSHRKYGPARRSPCVSVIIPVYNCRRYVATAIQSIRIQSFHDLELILVDDGSTDGSVAVMNRAAEQDDRIRIIQRRNTGIVGALNDGVAACSGEFIARMDADDIALVDRLAVQMDYLAGHIDCVALGTAVLLTDPEGRPLKTDRKSVV